jgi:hypothetical protein
MAVQRVDVALIDVWCGKGLAQACIAAKVDKERDYTLNTEVRYNNALFLISHNTQLMKPKH